MEARAALSCRAVACILRTAAAERGEEVIAVEEEERRAPWEEVEAEEERKRSVEAARRRDVERARAQIQSQREEEARQLAKSLKERGTLKADLDVRIFFITLRLRFSFADDIWVGVDADGAEHG